MIPWLAVEYPTVGWPAAAVRQAARLPAAPLPAGVLQVATRFVELAELPAEFGPIQQREAPTHSELEVSSNNPPQDVLAKNISRKPYL